jgi:hypothetical protein
MCKSTYTKAGRGLSDYKLFASPRSFQAKIESVPSRADAETAKGLTLDEALTELIELIVQVLDDVLRFNRREFFVCHMTTVAQPLFQSIQRLNDSVLAGVDASVVASHAVSVMQALPVSAVARQFGGVGAPASAESIVIRPECLS